MPLSIGFLLLKHLFFIFGIGFLYSISHDILQLDSVKKVPFRRSVVDNVTHIILGIISWLLSVSYEKLYQPYNIINCLLCGFFAGIVDIDHFLMAKSFSLNDALSLPSRAPFHNTTLMFFSILSFIVVTYTTGYLKLSYVGWILLVAVISHHLRDSLHRGLWLWPIQFKPMKRFPCLLLTYCFPLIVGILIHYLYKSHNLTVKYDFIV